MAERYEPTLIRLDAGKEDVAVPMRDGGGLEIGAELLRAASFDFGKIIAWPTALEADGSWSQKDVVLTLRAPGRWAVAVRKEQRVTMAARSLEDLPRGQAFTVYLEDDHRRVQFDPLQVVAPARLDFVWRRVEGCTLVFSVPLPTSGTVVFTPHDRRSNEPMLSGSITLELGATTTFVPCAAGRLWFVDGCGAGWQFAAPIVIDPSHGDILHAVDIRDAGQLLAIVGDGGLDADNIQILFAKRTPNRREFERVTFDPMVRGPRIVRAERGWIVRDLSPTMDLFAHLDQCNALIELDVSGRTNIRIQNPETRPAFRVLDADLAVLRAELLAVREGDPWVTLDQWIPAQGGGTWYPTRSCSLRRDQLLSGTVPISGLVGARYRLRIKLAGRDWTVLLE